MSDSRNVDSVFQAAIELDSDASRTAFVREACGNDDELRRRVDRLLAAHLQAGNFMSITEAVSPSKDERAAEQPGTIIGRYKLLEQVGEGGMGVVFVAEQTEPVRRRVALKIIKPGMDSKQVIARFEAERQALAMMDHPNIAKVLDAGTTDASRPYFVMELVRGMPITEYCDKARLSPRQRLELFVDVCQAVQHAHQKGIIHRDLKPSNVMVTLHDGTPVVKVIDFGVAKAVGQQLTERTIYTALTQLVGTPLYMSPEQAEMSGLDVDTRSDVYSLGVLLYELLTGQTPFDKETLSKAGLDEMRRIIREDEPLRPSRRFSTLGAAAISTASQHRGLDERRLSKILSGELDWIVMKALEKDRTRRYESASAFAADIQRYLSDEPVLACPPTTMYRFQKFARKHKPILATAAAIALCLILGTTVSAWQAVRATTAEAQANINKEQAQANSQKADDKALEASTQRDEAQRQRDEVRALNDKLQRTLYTSNMNLARHAWEEGAAQRVRDLLEQHRPKPGQPDLRGFEWHYLYRLTHAEVLSLKEAGDVSFTPDGQRLISIAIGPPTSAKVLKGWDSRTGQQLYALNGVINFGISGDSKRIAGAVGDGKRIAWPVREAMTSKFALKVWDSKTGQELRSIEYVPADNPTPWLTLYATISTDGKYLASTSSDRTVRVWDAETGRELISLKGLSSTVSNVFFSPDGKRLAVCNSNTDGGRVKLWNSQTGAELLDFKGGGGATREVVFSPDSKRLACRDQKQVKVWDANRGQELFNLQGHTDQVEYVAFSPSSKLLASTSADQTVKLWDIETGKEIRTLGGHVGERLSVAFSPDGKRLVSRDEQNLKVWDAFTGQKLRTIENGGFNYYSNYRSMSFNPDGSRLACTYQGGVVKVWDAHAEAAPLTLKGGTRDDYKNASVAYSPDGKRLVGAVKDTVAKVWDPFTGQELLTVKGRGQTNRWGGEFEHIAFSPDGKRLVAGGLGPKGWWNTPGEIKVLDSHTGQELLAFQGHVDHIYRVAYSPDGKRLASCTSNQFGAAKPDVKVWDAQTGRELLTFPGSSDKLAFSPDGTRLASDSNVWDANTGQKLLKLKGGEIMAFSPDGKRLASGNGNGMKIWDATTGDELLTLKGHASGVFDAAFSGDGKRLASASDDQTVKVWDTQTGQELLTLKGHTDRVCSVAFSSSGYQLASASWDGTIKIWDATPLAEKP